MDKLKEPGTWNGVGGLLLGISGVLRTDTTFSAFGTANTEWAVITFAASVLCFCLGVCFKG